MSGPDETDTQPSLARELLNFYDELATLNASSAFVMQSMAAALTEGGGLDERAATGAVFCAQGLNDRAVELEQQFKKILARVHVPGAGRKRKGS
jgi:hypothetical protein